MLSLFAANQSDRIDVEKNCYRAPLDGSFRVEEVGLAERQLERMYVLGILVQQVAQIRGRSVIRCDRQQHGRKYTVPLLETRQAQGIAEQV